MKVNLKKAAALAAAVAAISVKYDHAYGVDTYADPPSQAFVDSARQQLSHQITTGLTLVEASFVIRTLIGKANEGMVNAVLTERAKIEKQLAVLNSIPTRRQATNLEALQRQIAAYQQGGDNARVFGRGSITLELETETLLAPLAKPLRKKKRELDEMLQTLNYNTQIELPDDLVKLLTELDLI